MRFGVTWGRWAGAAVLGATAFGCATPRDQLVRSQQSFEQSGGDLRALVLLRDLEPDVNRLDVADRARYAYLRGMADYRLGHRGDARHWLALARAYEDTAPGTLPVDWKTRAGQALDEMNAVVHEAGFSALAGSRKPE